MTSRDVPAYPRREPATDTTDDDRLLNWARNATLGRVRAVWEPATEGELRTLLAADDRPVRVIGNRMSPGRLLGTADDGGALLDLHSFDVPPAVTGETVTATGATSLADLYATLTRDGRMLPSSPGVIAEQTLAGALATGTHGQGLGQSTVADAVTSLRLVTADGTVQEFERGHPWFPAVQLGLGTLGVTTQVTLRTRTSPVYTCRKTAVADDGLEHDLARWNRDHTLVKAWWFPGERQVQVWAADEAAAPDVERYRAGGNELLEHEGRSDAMNATVERTLATMKDDTRIVDATGKPFRTVARFRDFTDVTGDIYQVFCRGIATPQINVEIGIPLERAGAVIATLKSWYAATRPRMHYPIILRCTGPSEAWLSPSYGADTCYFGFVVYYAEDGSLSAEGEDFLHAVEAVLAAEGGRPHWGKYFDESLYDWPALYPRWEQFRQARAALDPAGRFANSFTRTLFGQPAAVPA